MPKRFLAWIEDCIQLRVEEVSDGEWRGYVQVRPQRTPLGTLYTSDPFRAVTEGGAKTGAAATVRNEYPQFAPALERLQWRDLSDLPDKEWRKGLQAWMAPSKGG